MIPEAIVVQTVPSREFMIGALLAKLEQNGLPVEVSCDPDYRGTQWHLQKIMKEHPEGVLILQDDVIVADWFREELDKAMVEDKPMSLFLGMTKKLLELHKAGYHYGLTQNMWGQANYYPKWFIADYLEWATPENLWDEKKGRVTLADDHGLCKFCREKDYSFWVTIPNLVEHNHHLPSTLGHPKTVRGLPRVSALFGKKYLPERWDAALVANIK